MTGMSAFSRTPCAGAILAAILVMATPAGGFDDRLTHRQMTRRAAQESSIDNTLVNELGIVQGGSVILRSSVGETLSALDWLSSGSELEDEPACRASNHFHNPLKAFLDAAVTDVPLPIRQYCASQGFDQPWSSATWGTRHVSPTLARSVTGNPSDWDAARRSYLDSLTLMAPASREAALASTFETLGHLMHLVQDLAVPAHARNDFQAHLDLFPKRAPFSRWFENRFERFVRRNPELVDTASPTLIGFAGRRLTRFWDLDLYDGANPSADLDQGLAEYTNANFASANTIFTEMLDPADPYRFPFPRQSSTNIAELIQQSFTVARTTQAEDRTVDLGLYLRKERDGEQVDHFLRAGYLTRDLIDNAPPDVMRLSFQLDDVVHRDYAALLVPRALGYSKSLLEYFFRGKLDVDVIAEADDPAVVRVKGTNGSVEALVDGTLALYGDDPNGVRSAATTQGDSAVTNVAVGGEISSTRFQLPADTERVVAVYQGTLGSEVKNPETNFPGGVIGKVLGGVRVEQIFADGGAWKIRTPRGVFILPLTTDEFEEVKWGDGHDIIVARTPFGDDQPNRFVSYRVARRADSADFTVSGPAPLTLVPLGDVVFPLGMPVGTSVRFSQNVRYRQQIARVGPITSFFHWEGLRYVFDHAEISDPEPAFETVHSQTLSFSDQFPIVLDTFHNNSFLDVAATDSRYLWIISDVTADAAGRLLAVIEVRLLRPNDGGLVPFVAVNAQSGALEEQGHAFVPAFFPVGINPLLWAVIDLRARQVVASSVPPEVAITSDTAAEAPPWAEPSFASAPFHSAGLYAQNVSVFVDGPTPGVESVWGALDLQTLDRSRTTPVFVGEVASTVGQQSVSVGGWPGSELAVALPASYQVVDTQTRTEKAYLGKSATEAYALTLVTHQGRFADHPPRLMDARRTRPTAAGTERVVFLAERRGNDDLGIGHVVVWEPQQARARVAADLPLDVYHLRSAASGAALVVSRTPSPTTRVVALDGAVPPQTLEGDLSQSFTLLDPAYLYNVDDFRFYRQAPLQATVLPARLSPATAPGGEFHAIRLP